MSSEKQQKDLITFPALINVGTRYEMMRLTYFERFVFSGFERITGIDIYLYRSFYRALKISQTGACYSNTGKAFMHFASLEPINLSKPGFVSVRNYYADQIKINDVDRVFLMSQEGNREAAARDVKTIQNLIDPMHFNLRGNLPNMCRYRVR